MKKNSSEIKTIYPERIVKYYSYGDTLEISNVIRDQSIVVLPNRKYAVLSTGEIKDMTNKESSQQALV